MKSFFLCLLAGLIMAGNASAQLYLVTEYSLGFSSDILPHQKIGNIPEFMRTVPIHHDDSDIPEENNGPIPPRVKDVARPGFTLLCTLDEMIQLRNKNMAISIGGSIWAYAGPFRDKLSERAYRGLVGSPYRGEGTALTFYLLYNNGIILSPFCYLKIPINNSVSFSTSLRTYSSKIAVSNGWDRYDHYKVYKKFILANYEINEITAGFIKKNNTNLINSAGDTRWFYLSEMRLELCLDRISRVKSTAKNVTVRVGKERTPSVRFQLVHTF